MTTRQRENLALFVIALVLAGGAWILLVHPEWLMVLVTNG